MLGLKVVKRGEPNIWGSPLISLGALAVALGLGALLPALQGNSPWAVPALLWDGAFAHLYSLEDTVLKSVPIFLCSLGVAVCFRMQIWNIGAEGQYAMGAAGGTWAALTFSHWPAYALMPTMFLCAVLAGGFWAFIPAVLRVKAGVNEIISTLMLNYIGILFLEWKLYGAWKDPVSHGYPMTELFSDAAVVGSLFGGRLHWGLPFCIAAGLLLYFFIHRTKLGFELKAAGENPRAAQYARIPYGLLAGLVMVLCGAFAGTAGAMETSAMLHRLQPGVIAGYGYTAIVTAWLGRLRIPDIAFFSILLAGVRVGVENMQLELQIPAAYGRILEGLILMCVLAGRFFQNYRLRFTARGSGEEGK